jgi:predicted porin
MAAVTGAMAQATIYGTIDQAYESTKLSVGKDTTKTTKISGTMNGGSAIGFKGSEDLGNGMKAYFQQEIGLSTDQNDTSYENRNSFVGLSGGFGAVQIGRQYNFAFFNAISNDPLSYTGTSGYAVGYGGPGGASRTSNMIAYTAPTFVPGVGIQLGKALGETVTTNANPTKTGDSTSYGVTYAAGPLYAGTTGETVTGANAITPKTKNSTTTITYDLGMVKVGYGAGKTTAGNVYNKGGAMSITVPVGALTLSLSSGDRKTNASGAEVKTKVSQYGGIYAMSKRTSAYLQTGKQSATATSTNIYAVGLRHDF